MHVISKHPKLSDFWTEYPDAKGPLLAWYRVAEKTDWANFAEVRETYAHVSQYQQFTIFNIGGNKYRLIVRINFASGTIFVRHVLTHEEYDRDEWKGE